MTLLLCRSHRSGHQCTDPLVVEPCTSGLPDPCRQGLLQSDPLFGCRVERTFDECSATRPSFSEPLLLEFAVGAVDGIRVDGDLADHVTYRRELVSGPEDSELEGLADLVHELSVGRHTGGAVEPKFDGRLRNYCLNILVH